MNSNLYELQLFIQHQLTVSLSWPDTKLTNRIRIIRSTQLKFSLCTVYLVLLKQLCRYAASHCQQQSKIYLWKQKMGLVEVSLSSREKYRMVHLHKLHSTREDLKSILLRLDLHIHHSICTLVEYFLEFLKTNTFIHN